MRLAVVLHELFEHDRPRGHVDAQRERLGREHDLDQPADEQLLDRLLERGQQPGVVRRDAPFQGLTPLPVPEHGQVGLRQVARLLVDDPANLLGLLRRVEPQSRTGRLRDRRVTTRTAEHEHDRGQQGGRVEPLDHVGARGRLEPAVARRAAWAAATAAVAPAAERHVVARELLGLAQHLGVDPRVRLVALEQVEHLVAHQHVLPQRHRPVLVDDDRRVPAHLDQPLAELLGVADRRGQADHLHVLRQVQDDLFPHGAAEPVREVVHLVHHDVRESVQSGRTRVEHVPQHLGGHDDHGRTAVDARVTGEQADLVRPVPRGEVGELLVAQGLDRRGVEALAAAGQGQVHGELAHHRLA